MSALPAMDAIRVLLVDDHAIVRAGLRALLATAGDMHIIGEAEDGRQAVREAQRLRPEVVLLDLAMPLLNGVEAARQIAQDVPAAKVLILSSYSDTPHLRQAVAVGVAGYLMKESAGEELLKAIRETRSGGAFFSPCLLGRLMQETREVPRDDCGGTDRPAILTRREAEVLQLIAEGYATKQIADLLSLSTKTVEKHRQTLMRKLHLHRIASLTRYAVSNGVVEVSSFRNWRVARLPFAPLGDSDNSALAHLHSNHGNRRPRPQESACAGASLPPADNAPAAKAVNTRYDTLSPVHARSRTCQINCPRCGKPMQLLLAAGVRLEGALRLARLILCDACCDRRRTDPTAQPALAR